MNGTNNRISPSTHPTEIAKAVAFKHGYKLEIHGMNIDNPAPVICHLENLEDSSIIYSKPNETPIRLIIRIGWLPESEEDEEFSDYFERIKDEYLNDIELIEGDCVSKNKLYLVSYMLDINIRYIVKASSKREAIEKVWKRYILPENIIKCNMTGSTCDKYVKEEFTAADIDKRMKKFDKENKDAYFIY